MASNGFSRQAQAHGRAGDGDAHEQARSSRSPDREQSLPRRAREAFFASLLARAALLARRRGPPPASSKAPGSRSLGWQPEELHGWYWEELVHPARPRRASTRSSTGSRPATGSRARRRPAARRPGGRLPPDELDLRRGLGHGQHPRPRPRPHGSAGRGSDETPLGPPGAPQRRPRRAPRRARGALRRGRALRGHRGPPARRAARDRRELGDPRRRRARRRTSTRCSATGSTRSAAARPAPAG